MAFTLFGHCLSLKRKSGACPKLNLSLLPTKVKVDHRNSKKSGISIHVICTISLLNIIFASAFVCTSQQNNPDRQSYCRISIFLKLLFFLNYFFCYFVSLVCTGPSSLFWEGNLDFGGVHEPGIVFFKTTSKNGGGRYNRFAFLDSFSPRLWDNRYCHKQGRVIPSLTLC